MFHSGFVPMLHLGLAVYSQDTVLHLSRCVVRSDPSSREPVQILTQMWPDPTWIKIFMYMYMLICYTCIWTNKSCHTRDLPRVQFEVEHVGAHERSRSRLNGGQGQNKGSHLHHVPVGIAIHVYRCLLKWTFWRHDIFLTSWPTS